MTEVSENITGTTNVAFIGFGEAAQAFTRGWHEADVDVAISAYDRKTDEADAIRQKKLADYKTANVKGYENIREAVPHTDIIFSLVTADQAVNAATSCAQVLSNTPLYLDCNSCAPHTKQKAADIINKAGGRYIDVAVMSPVHPRLHKTPLLLSGPETNNALRILKRLGMSAKGIDGDIGRASSIKLTRSIMIKGLEALVAECVLTGHKLGVSDIVLDTLDDTFPGFNWQEMADNMIKRMVIHGERRAAEMQAATSMIKNIGLPAYMSQASADWQQHIGSLALPHNQKNYKELADIILKSMQQE